MSGGSPWDGYADENTLDVAELDRMYWRASAHGFWDDLQGVSDFTGAPPGTEEFVRLLLALPELLRLAQERNELTSKIERVRAECLASKGRTAGAYALTRWVLDVIDGEAS